MAVIKSGATTDNLTIDPTSKAARVTPYDTAGVVFGTGANPLITKTGVTEEGRYSVSIFRTVGLASANHNIFTLENPVGSGKKLGIVRIIYQSEHTAISTALVKVATCRLTTLPTGGTTLTSVKNATADATTVAVANGATASDGGAATAITATLTNIAWAQLRQRMITAAGYITTPDNPLLPITTDDNPFVLAAGEALLVQVVTAALTTDSHLVNCAYIQYV